METLEGFIVSKPIERINKVLQDVYPYWDELEAKCATGNDEYLVQGSQVKAVIPYDTSKDISVDETALVIRTLVRKNKSLQIFRVGKSEYSIFLLVPSMSPAWRVIPGSARRTQYEAEKYLAFCSSNDSGLD